MQLRLKYVTHFSCYESLTKGYNVSLSLMRFYVTQCSTTRFYVSLSVYLAAPFRPVAAQLKRLSAILVFDRNS